MLKRIEEFDRYVKISGFKNVKIVNTKEFLDKTNMEKPFGIEVQFFNARLVVTWEHLYFAVLNALAVFKNNENISKSLPIEALLYAAGERQITKAMELIGIRPASSDVAVLIIGKKPQVIESAFSKVSRTIGARLDEKVLELSEDKAIAIQKVYGISEAELEAVMQKDGLKKTLTDLVIERMALLATQR